MIRKLKKMVKWGVLFVVLLILLSSAFLLFRGTYTPTPSDVPFIGNRNGFEVGESIDLQDELSAFADNLESGGPPPDGIPPVDEPEYISVEGADDFLEDESRVFVVDINGEVKIFPQQVLVWHEIVNDTFGGEDLSVTYCPLTGTAIGYKNQFDNVHSDFGTSGKLLNSNLVMYDRETDSLWPQILGTAITGDSRGTELDTFPVHWAKWVDAKAVYPDALVLSKKTGFIRSYGFDPYGSYLNEGTYYDSGNPFFPLMNEDDRLDPKTVVIAIKNGDEQMAVLKSKVEAEKLVQVTVGGELINLNWDEALKTVMVKSAATGEWVTSFDSMWFPWVAYYPKTALVE